MAVIPDYQAVGVSAPSGRMNVARASGASPVSSAIEDVGNVVGRIAEKKYKEQTDLAVATAKNEYLRSSIELANKVQDDPNYQGWQDTYDAATEAERARIGAQIQDPRARQYFDLEAQTESTRVSVGLAQKSRQRFDETKRVGLDQTLDENGKALLATDDPEARSSLMVGTNQIIDALAADGTITGDQARAKKKAFAEGFGKNSADAMIPAARLDILQRGMKTDSTGRVTFEKNGTFADFIPDAERMQMIKVAEAELQGQRNAAIADQRQRSEEAYKGYVDQIIADPRQLDIKAVAKDPNLSGEHGETLLRLYQEQMKKLADGTDGLEGKHGPGFWKMFQGVTAQGDARITDPHEIYRRAGPGGDLTLADAKTLVDLQKEQKDSVAKGDGDAAATAEFYRNARRVMVTAPGIKSQEDAFHSWFQKTRARDAQLKQTMTAGQRYADDGELGKTVKPIPVDDGTFVTPPPAPQPSILSRVEGFFAGTAAANKARSEPKTKDEIIAAYKAGHIDRQRASDLLTKLGHPLRAAAPTSAGVPTVQ